MIQRCLSKFGNVQKSMMKFCEENTVNSCVWNADGNLSSRTIISNNKYISRWIFKHLLQFSCFILQVIKCFKSLSILETSLAM